jgi:hypothetical protein
VVVLVARNPSAELILKFWGGSSISNANKDVISAAMVGESAIEVAYPFFNTVCIPNTNAVFWSACIRNSAGDWGTDATRIGEFSCCCATLLA